MLQSTIASKHFEYLMCYNSETLRCQDLKLA